MTENRSNFSAAELHNAARQIARANSVEEQSGKIVQVVSEFAEGYDKLSEIHPAVSFFGSARTKRSHPHYRLARRTAKLLSGSGFSIISGGGPGIMEAVNRGARDGGSPSIGLNIVLPGSTEPPNAYQDVSITFHNFFVRKLMFVQYASAYVVMPGGLGTLDEVIECLVLMQTDKARRIPVILAGTDFWRGLVSWLEDTLLAEKTIKASDFELFQVLDAPEEVRDAIMDHYEANGSSQLSKHHPVRI